MLPSRSTLGAPKHWMDEDAGAVEPAMRRFLKNEPEQADDCMLIRLYLRQWIDSAKWDLSPHMSAEDRAELAVLRYMVRNLETRRHISEWLERVTDATMDPR